MKLNASALLKPRSWRLIPRGLAGQLTLLLIGALVVGHVVTFWILAGEREEAAQSTARQFVVSRTASVYRLLTETSEDNHKSFIRAVSSPLSRYSLSQEPRTKERPDSRFEQRIARALLQELELPESTDIRLMIKLGSWHDHDPDERAKRDRGRRLPPAYLSISMPIEAGVFEDNPRWLNVRISNDGRAPAWALASLLSLGIAALGIVVVVAFMARRISRPLTELAQAASRFGATGEVARLKPSGALEIRNTIGAFNAMQERIGRFVADRTQMLAAMGHDLRTPITSLRLQAEFIEDEAVQRKIIDLLAEMQGMAEATLAFAREDAAQEQARRTDLTALIESLVIDARERGQDVSFDAGDPIIATVRSLALKRALSNLIDNACRYGVRARIALNADKNVIAITVDDDGPGIDPAKLDDVFEPFVRLETSRSRETGGAGLGLSIVRTIIHSHGGKIRLANREGGGLRAQIELPA